MKDVHDWATVKKLHKKGIPIKKISRDLKMSKNTVKKLIKLDKEPKYTREIYPSKVSTYKDQIREWYLNPEYNFNGTRIFRELQKIGYEHSIGPVYRYLKELSEGKKQVSSKATIRIETPLGDQAQFDWSPYKMIIGEELKQVYCFTMILAASRKKAIVFSSTSDGDAIYEAIQELFSDLGGVTKELLIDNPKALVLQNELGKEPVFNKSALRLALHLGTELNPCAPYRARAKGKIEKPYQYIEEQFIKGNKFASMTALNIAGKTFIDEWNGQVHGTTKRIPNEVFSEEKSQLYPIKDNQFINSALKDRKVSLDSLVSVNGKKYSVPVEYVDKKVKIRIVYGYRLEIYDLKIKLICTHELADGKNSVQSNAKHYDLINKVLPKSIPEIQRQFEASFDLGEDYYSKASKFLQQPSYHARQILKLKELYCSENLNKILDYCISNEKFRIEEIKEIIRENYLEIILNKMTADLKTSNAPIEYTSNGLDITEGLVRNTAYYEGGQN